MRDVTEAWLDTSSMLDDIHYVARHYKTLLLNTHDLSQVEKEVERAEAVIAYVRKQKANPPAPPASAEEA